MHLLLSVHNIRPPIARYVSLHSLLLVCWYANMQLWSFFLHSIFDCAHVRKVQAFPCLHNFSVRIVELVSLGTMLRLMVICA